MKKKDLSKILTNVWYGIFALTAMLSISCAMTVYELIPGAKQHEFMLTDYVPAWIPILAPIFLLFISWVFHTKIVPWLGYRITLWGAMKVD